MAAVFIGNTCRTEAWVISMILLYLKIYLIKWFIFDKVILLYLIRNLVMCVSHSASLYNCEYTLKSIYIFSVLAIQYEQLIAGENSASS